MSKKTNKAITAISYAILFGYGMYLTRNETINIKLGFSIIVILFAILNELINIRYKDEKNK